MVISTRRTWPSSGKFDLWLVRKHGGSWEELSSTRFGSVTHDSVLADTTPVCL